MKAIMLMFDSLNRHMLPPYGCDWVKAPNFSRLADRSVTFDNCYVGSMPCMPARRELHTGRYNFLHRGWGPLEPYDDSMPEILKQNGISTHLVSDHYHYWEDGGATYHTRYSTWDASRGQEGDPWKADLTDRVPVPPNLNKRRPEWNRQDWVNRHYMRKEEDQPQPKTMRMAEEFLRTNHAVDNWFLHIETFDPHEPWFCPQRFKDLYPHNYKGPIFDWPPYSRVTEPPEQVEHLRCENAALHSMCDFYLGRILSLMDELGLWKDTMLIVNTDHGFLLSEHDLWAKCHCPWYNELAHTPLFIWDPRSGRKGERRNALVQTVDLPATLLEFFGVDRPKDMQGVPLRETLVSDKPVREGALFGIHGGHVNVTDGRFVYMRAPARPGNGPLFNYTTMSTKMRGFLSLDQLRGLTVAPPFAFTKGVPVMKIPASEGSVTHNYGTMLFDLEKDPKQDHPIQSRDIEGRMADLMARLMKANDAPKEQFERLGLAG